MIGGGVYNTPEVEIVLEVSENTSDIQKLKTPEHLTWGSESPKTPLSQQRENIH
jgi:hypothetical protein